MFINYKKRYKKILEIINSEIENNYDSYNKAERDLSYYSVENPDARLLKLNKHFKDVEKFKNRYLSLCDLKNKIKREFEK